MLPGFPAVSSSPADDVGGGGIIKYVTFRISGEVDEQGCVLRQEGEVARGEGGRRAVDQTRRLGGSVTGQDLEPFALDPPGSIGQ